VKSGKSIILSGVLIFFALVSFKATAYAKDYTGKKAVLVIVDRISFEDMEGLHGFEELMNNGSIALMNNRPSGAYSACKGYVSIGSGARAEATPSAVGALEVDHETMELFYSRTGEKVTPGMVVNPYINKLVSQNLNGEYGASAGTLGDVLRRAGLKTSLLGNADCGDTQVRWAVSIAMDKKGIVDYGMVGDHVLKEDGGFPTGRRTDFAKLMSYLDQALQRTDFIVIETGDMTRIEESRDLLNEAMYGHHRRETLLGISGFLCNLKQKADKEGWLLILAVPYPANEEIARGARLTPLIVYGGDFSKGLLTSSTTRREGIVAAIDIAPTVLGYFGMKSENLTGRPLRTVPDGESISRVRELGFITVNTSNFRYPILYNYAVFVILVVLLGLFIILYPAFFKGILVPPVEIALTFTMVFPAVLLVLPLFKLQTLAGNAAAAVLAAAGLGIVLHGMTKNVKVLLLVVSGLTVLLIVLDVVTGGRLIQNSVLGYDPIIGARYYGIGNEYMGIVAGSAITALCSICESIRVPLWSVVAVLGIVAFVVGYPALGANLGGAITCFLAFAFLVLRIRETRIGVKQARAGALALAAVLAAFLLADAVFLEDHSHIAAAAQAAANSGYSGLLTIVRRKLAMNMKLLRYTVWTKVLITVITVTGILFYRPVGFFKGVFAKYPYYAKGWSALVVAAATGMAVNDSGVVTSATGSIFFITSLLYILIQERKIQRGPAKVPGKKDGIQGFGKDGD
jgi:hypothetical protein